MKQNAPNLHIVSVPMEDRYGNMIQPFSFVIDPDTNQLYFSLAIYNDGNGTWDSGNPPDFPDRYAFYGANNEKYALRKLIRVEVYRDNALVVGYEPIALPDCGEHVALKGVDGAGYNGSGPDGFHISPGFVSLITDNNLGTPDLPAGLIQLPGSYVAGSYEVRGILDPYSIWSMRELAIGTMVIGSVAGTTGNAVLRQPILSIRGKK